jgi:hypothetical protein
VKLIIMLFFVSIAFAQSPDKFLPDLGGSKTESVWGPSTSQCKCIKNENGECMNMSRRGMPRYSRGSGTQNQFLPNCVENCLPGYADYETATYHPRTDTLKEMQHCYIDWKRLERLNPQWRDPNWTP